MPVPASRQCREYERPWQDRFVDRNLADDWLVALNTLDVFRLISICEGHSEGGGRRASGPHINLRLRPELVRAAYAGWDGLSVGLAAEFGRLFRPEDGTAEVELRLPIRLGRDGVHTQPDLVVRLQSLRRRASPELEPWAADWLAAAVGQCRALDEFVGRRLGHSR